MNKFTNSFTDERTESSYLQRKTNQFNKLQRGTNLAEVPKEMREQNNLIKGELESVLKEDLGSFDKLWAQLKQR
jgi:transcriptional regulator of heat shock response